MGQRQMRSFRSSRLVLFATSADGLAGTRRRGGAGGIGACVSPGPWRMKPPGPTDRYWMVVPSRATAPMGRWIGAGVRASASFASGAILGAGRGSGALAALGEGLGLSALGAAAGAA